MVTLDIKFALGRGNLWLLPTLFNCLSLDRPAPVFRLEAMLNLQVPRLLLRRPRHDGFSLLLSVHRLQTVLRAIRLNNVLAINVEISILVVGGDAAFRRYHLAST